MKKVRKPILVGMSLLAAAIAGGCAKNTDIEEIYGPPSAFDPDYPGEEAGEAEEASGDETPGDDDQGDVTDELSDDANSDEPSGNGSDAVVDLEPISEKADPQIIQLMYGPPEMPD